MLKKKNVIYAEESVVPARQGDMMGKAASKSDFDKIARLKSEEWTEILPRTELGAGYEDTRHAFFNVAVEEVFTHLRVDIYPDGGIARLRAYGIVMFDPKNIVINGNIDLLSLHNGAKCIDFSNAHYGHPINLIKPNRGINMGDGWETARRLDRPSVIEVDDNGILQVPGEEWAVFQMCTFGTVVHIEIDTNHFKGNFPNNVKIEGAILDDVDDWKEAKWTLLLDKQKLGPHKQHNYKKEILERGPFNFIKITMAPDGGISRVRIFGQVQSFETKQ